MKVHLGVLFICLISKFKQAKGGDIEQDDIERFGSTVLQKYDIGILTNTSTTNPEQFRMRSRRHAGGGTCGRCGVANIEQEIRTSIVNGDDVHPPYKYPWAVAVRTFGQISCTGSIINEYFILTASHCFIKQLNKYIPFKPSKTRVPYILPSQVSVDIWKRSRLPVKRIIPHANFDISQWRNDIALLQMKGRIFCNRFASTICIPPPNFALPRGAILVIAGFGSDKTGKKTTIDHLKEAKVNQVSYNVCHFPNHMKDGTYYCLKGLNYIQKKRQTACFGDSGGPMIYRHGNIFYQFGVASFGKECDISEAFLYTSVPAHLDWIYQSMRNFYGKGYSDKGAQEKATGKGAQKKATGKGAQKKATGKGLSAAGGPKHNRKAGGCRRGHKKTRRTKGQKVHEFAKAVKQGLRGYRATGLFSSRERRHLEADTFAEDGYDSKASPKAGGSGRVKRGNCPSL